MFVLRAKTLSKILQHRRTKTPHGPALLIRFSQRSGLCGLSMSFLETKGCMASYVVLRTWASSGRLQMPYDAPASLNNPTGFLASRGGVRMGNRDEARVGTISNPWHPWNRYMLTPLNSTPRFLRCDSILRWSCCSHSPGGPSE